MVGHQVAPWCRRLACTGLLLCRRAACTTEGQYTARETKNTLQEPLMQRLTAFLFLLLPAAASAQTKDGFIPLFNGKDLDGWEVRGSKKDMECWSLKDNQ